MPANADDLRQEIQRRARLAVRDAANRLRRELVNQTPVIEWVYDHPVREFPPHRALHGRHFESWEDDAIPEPSGAFPLGVSHYYPGDHNGCLCTYRVVVDPGSKSSRAWTVVFDESGSQLTARFANVRYDPAKMVLPGPRSGTRRAARVAVHREQIPARRREFYRDLLTQQRWHAEVTLSLATAR